MTQKFTDLNWGNLPKKSILLHVDKQELHFLNKEEALLELHMLKLMSANGLCNWADSAIKSINKVLPGLPVSGVKLKYEVSIEDIVNALNNLEDLVAEYFNLQRPNEDNAVDPENRHLGERDLVPGSINEGTTMETSRKGLLENLMNPADVEDERILHPEDQKDSDLIDIEEDLPPGPIESLLSQTPLIQTRDMLSKVTEEDMEPPSVNGAVNSSGQAYMDTPQDIKPEEENAEEEETDKSKESESGDKAAAGPEAKEQSEEEEEVEDEEDEDEKDRATARGESDTSTVNVNLEKKSWYGSKSSLEKSSSSKGMFHFKASEDGIIQAKQPISFSNFGKSRVEDYYPTDEELVDINTNHSLVHMSKESLIVLPIVAADTEVDRGGEHFTKEALESFVPLYVGKALLLDHNWTTANEVGKIFAAKVINDKLMVKAYIPNNKYSDQLLTNILAGVHCRASVGFSMDVRNVTCDSCMKANSKGSGGNNSPFTEGYVSIFDEDNCPHKPGALDEYGCKTTVTLHKVADVMELSFVPVPMQPKAGTDKHLLSLDTMAKTLNSVETQLKTLDAEASNIINSRTMGEKTVSDLTESSEGSEKMAEAPVAAGAFDVEGDQHRPTDDNLFARAALKQMVELTESLKAVVAELTEQVKANKESAQELKSLAVTKAKAEDSEESEEDEDSEEKRKALLSKLVEAAEALISNSKSTEVSEISSAKSAANPNDGTWLKSLVHDFNNVLGSN